MKKGRRDIKEPAHMLTTKFDILGKSDYSVWETGVSDFDSFRIGSRNELNMKI
jgi:hypothetical protein